MVSMKYSNLDGKSYEVPTSAFGGAAQIGSKNSLMVVDFADVLEIVMEGLDEVIYLEIERALKGAVTSPSAGKQTSQTSFANRNG